MNVQMEGGGILQMISLQIVINNQYQTKSKSYRLQLVNWGTKKL